MSLGTILLIILILILIGAVPTGPIPEAGATDRPVSWAWCLSCS